MALRLLPLSSSRAEIIELAELGVQLILQPLLLEKLELLLGGLGSGSGRLVDSLLKLLLLLSLRLGDGRRGRRGGRRPTFNFAVTFFSL